MATSIIILIVLGAIICIVGTIMFLVEAFRMSIWWGLGCLFLGPVGFVFLILHWAEARRGFVVSLVGTAVMAGAGYFSLKDQIKDFPSSEKLIQAMQEKAQPELAKKDTNAKIQELRDEIEKMEALKAHRNAELARLFPELNARRAALKPDDAAAVQKYTEESNAYTKLNEAQRQLLKDLDDRRAKLQELLDDRSRKAAEGAKQTSAKKVVMYTTASCPACHAAKSYFARKGVNYEEKDVNSSPAFRQEFQNLGGQGVPLIMVGNERMDGFSAQRLDQLL